MEVAVGGGGEFNVPNVLTRECLGQIVDRCDQRPITPEQPQAEEVLPPEVRKVLE